MGERRINPVDNIFKKYREMNLVDPYRFSKPFESTWRTSTTSVGSSTATQVKLPLISTGTYNFVVNWGDGTSDTITVWNQIQTTHTYSVAGDYTIKITGTCTGWQFNNGGDRLKILSIASWGGLKLGNVTAHFFGCSNLNLASVSDVLDVTGTSSFSSTFRSCTSLTTINKVNEWNTTSIGNMSFMFTLSSFNSNIGNWNVSNVLTFNSMFSESSFNNGGSPDINNWMIRTSGAVIMSSMFNITPFNQPVGNWNMSSVTNISNMFSGSTTVFNQPLNTWNTISVTDMSNVFTHNKAFNQNIGSWNVSSVTTFANMFLCSIGISTFNNGGSSDINNWILKNSGTINMTGMFNSARAFNQPIGNWNTGFVTTMASMFQNAIAFNQNIGTWSTGNVTTMASMFQNAIAFNQNIGSWNVSNCTNFSIMFNVANAFNNGGSPDINNWVLKTTGTITMFQMFKNAPVFNQPIGNWNTTVATSFREMFWGAIAFNQNIGSWSVTNVTNFNSMFLNNSAFNNGGSPDINNWVLNTTGAIDVISMFSGTTVFNQPLGNWNTVGVGSMANMFTNAQAFNQNIGSWNVSNVSDFTGMFSTSASTAFNNGGSSDINNWTLKTTGTVNMLSMFNNAYVFNQPLNLWNTIAVTNMSLMFNGAQAFDQNIGSWNVSNVTNFTSFMNGKTPVLFSTANLDAIYSNTTGWASRPVKPSINISFGSAKYTAAGSAGRAILTGAPNLWTITDGGI